MRHSMGLADKVAVVTGAANGIGRGIALGFAREGARVAVLDRDAAALEVTRAMVADLGAEVVALEVDTSERASVEAAEAELSRVMGPAEVLVNNAGISGHGGPLLDLPQEEWDRLLRVNLTGYFLCAQVFARGMVARGGGALVHVVSGTALYAYPNAGNYGIAKAGGLMLSHILAAELGPLGIRSNAIHPGLVQTEMTRASYADPAVAERRGRLVPQGRVAQPQDMAEAVLFLASLRAAYVNGADLVVDGGLTKNLMSLIPRAPFPGEVAAR